MAAIAVLLSHGAAADLVGHVEVRAAVSGKSDEELVGANPVLERLGRESPALLAEVLERLRAPAPEPRPTAAASCGTRRSQRRRRRPPSSPRIPTSPSTTATPPRPPSICCASSGRQRRSSSTARARPLQDRSVVKSMHHPPCKPTRRRRLPVSGGQRCRTALLTPPGLGRNAPVTRMDARKPSRYRSWSHRRNERSLTAIAPRLRLQVPEKWLPPPASRSVRTIRWPGIRHDTEPNPPVTKLPRDARGAEVFRTTPTRRPRGGPSFR